MSPRARSVRRARARAAAAPGARAPEAAAVPAGPPVRWPWAWPALVALATLAAFWPALGHRFLDWDDAMNLVDNPAFRGLGWSNLRWMFTTTLAGHWIPLTWISFGLDYLLWGMDPFGYHLTNVLLHAATAAVFYLVARHLLRLAMGGPERRLSIGALAAAMFFALHPMRVESVAWVTERRDVLSGLLFLLAILAYLKSARAPEGRRRWLVLSLACFVLAAMAKAIVMALPVILIVLDVYPLRRLPARGGAWTGPAARAVWIEKIPYLIVALATALMAGYALHAHGGMVADLPLATRLGAAMYGVAFYVRKTLIPIDVAPMYQMAARFDPTDGPILASAAGVLALTALLIWQRRRWPAGLAVWVTYLGLIAPVSGIVQSGPQLVAARYSYLSCLGMAVLVGGGVCWLLARAEAWSRVPWSGRIAGPAVVSLVGVGLAVLTWPLVWVWRDSRSLWEYAVRLEPDSPLARGNLGFAYLNEGRLQDAERETRAALRLAPEWELGQQNLAAVLARQERYVEAGEARAQLGYLLLKHGKYDDAVALFQKEVTVRPTDAAAHNNLGAALLLRGDVEAAIAHFEECLRLDPGHDKARRNLAAARRRR